MEDLLQKKSYFCKLKTGLNMFVNLYQYLNNNL
jgi:hypothetical protein